MTGGYTSHYTTTDLVGLELAPVRNACKSCPNDSILPFKAKSPPANIVFICAGFFSSKQDCRSWPRGPSYLGRQSCPYSHKKSRPLMAAGARLVKDIVLSRMQIRHRPLNCPLAPHAQLKKPGIAPISYNSKRKNAVCSAAINVMCYHLQCLCSIDRICYENIMIQKNNTVKGLARI